jgi:hypothetical protein
MEITFFMPESIASIYISSNLSYQRNALKRMNYLIPVLLCFPSIPEAATQKESERENDFSLSFFCVHISALGVGSSKFFVRILGEFKPASGWRYR